MTTQIEVGVNNPEWHDNTPTPFEIAYFCLHHGVSGKIITDQECERSKAAIKALIEQQDQLILAAKALCDDYEQAQHRAYVNNTPFYASSQSYAWQMRQAIAKVEGGAK